jgi:hypothetical protein
VKVIIPDVTKENHLTPYNITHERVVETVTYEDVKKIINLGRNFTVIMFLKNFKNHYLFVDSKWDTSTKLLEVSSVLIIPEQFVSTMSIENPLAVLEQFSNKIGYNIEIGDQNSKFIHDATVQLPIINDSEFVKLLYRKLKITDDEGKKAGPYIGNFLFRRVLNTSYVDIALAYFINVQKYTDYLRASGLLDSPNP